jgi:hypothetical protein
MALRLMAFGPALEPMALEPPAVAGAPPAAAAGPSQSGEPPSSTTGTGRLHRPHQAAGRSGSEGWTRPPHSRQR